MTIYVHTLGDSTLDNLYWLLNGYGTHSEQAKAASVEGQLQAKLGHLYKVVSHAYDGFTTSNVLFGGIVGSIFPAQSGPKFEAYIKEKISESASREVRPLGKLAEEISKNPDAIHYVVISVGGNDFRENLRNPVRLLEDVPQIQQRYQVILEQVQSMGNNIRPILMFQYRTDARNDPYRIYTVLGSAAGVAALVNALCIATIAIFSFKLAAQKTNIFSRSAFILIAAAIFVGTSRTIPLKVTKGMLLGQKPGITMIGALMEKFYKPMLKRANIANLPILDLPNSFNPYEAMYISGIEPSKEGGELIAQGLCNIIKGNQHPGHDYTSSKIYSCNGQVTNNLTDKWQVKYPSRPVSNETAS